MLSKNQSDLIQEEKCGNMYLMTDELNPNEQVFHPDELLFLRSQQCVQFLNEQLMNFCVDYPDSYPGTSQCANFINQFKKSASTWPRKFNEGTVQWETLGRILGQIFCVGARKFDISLMYKVYHQPEYEILSATGNLWSNPAKNVYRVLINYILKILPRVTDQELIKVQEQIHVVSEKERLIQSVARLQNKIRANQTIQKLVRQLHGGWSAREEELKGISALKQNELESEMALGLKLKEYPLLDDKTVTTILCRSRMRKNLEQFLCDLKQRIQADERKIQEDIQMDLLYREQQRIRIELIKENAKIQGSRSLQELRYKKYLSNPKKIQVSDLPVFGQSNLSVIFLF